MRAGKEATIVVTGLAGSLGRRIAERLAARPDIGRIVGIDVTPLVGYPDKVEGHVLDLGKVPRAGPDPLAPLLRDVDGLIHLAWVTPDQPGTHSATGRGEANLQALRRLLDAAGGSELPSLVHLSSATVYGAWADNGVPLTEDAAIRPNPEFSFAVEKAEAERVLAEWSDQHPAVPVAVLRPSVTVGSEQHPLYQALGGTRSPRSDEGRRPVQFLHIDDLASAVIFVWEHRLSGVYNVAADGGIGDATARALAGGVARVALPGRLAQVVAAWSWQLWRAGTPKEALAYSIHPWVVAPDRLKGAGWAPQYTSEEALVATDVRSHWDDLPPGRRQELSLLVAASGVVSAGAGLTAAVMALRRRRHRRRDAPA